MLGRIVAVAEQVQGRCLKGGWNGNRKNRLGIRTSTLSCVTRSWIGRGLFTKDISFV